MERHRSRTFPRERQIVQRVPKGARCIAHSLQRQPQPQPYGQLQQLFATTCRGQYRPLVSRTRETGSKLRNEEKRNSNLREQQRFLIALIFACRKLGSRARPQDKETARRDELDCAENRNDRRKIEISNNDCVSDLGYWIHTRT